MRRCWLVSMSMALLAPLLAVVAVAPAPVTAATGCTSQPFVDVPTSNVFCSEIEWMAEEGISHGDDGGRFRPTAVVTRQAMSAFMARFAGAGDLAPCTSKPFVDVSVGHPFCPEIAWMKASGVSEGNNAGEFSPTDAVSRQAMAAFMVRLVGETPPPCTSVPFDDVSRTSTFCPAIDWLVDGNITSGYYLGIFRPRAVVTRQQMSAFLYRLNLWPDAPPLPTPPPPPPPPPPPVSVADAAETAILTFMNAKRLAAGKAPYVRTSCLDALAVDWSARMQNDVGLIHRSNLQTAFESICHPTGSYAWGENIAYGPTIDLINVGWWNSAGHRSNILGGSNGFTKVGIGVTWDAARNRFWATVNFGKY